MPFTAAIAQVVKAAAGGFATLSAVQATAAAAVTAGLLSIGVISVLPPRMPAEAPPLVAREPAAQEPAAQEPAAQEPVASQDELDQARHRLKDGLEATYAGRPTDVTPIEAPLTPADTAPAEARLVAPEVPKPAEASPAAEAKAEPAVPLAVTPPEPRLWTALPPPDVSPGTTPPAATPAPSVEAALPDETPWTPTPQPELLGKARGMLAKGDVSGARLWLDMASERGDADAAFRLAETYDPAILAQWGVLGMTSDVARARALYARALAGGVEAARERIARLDP